VHSLLCSSDVFHLIAAPDEGVEEVGGYAVEKEQAAHRPGRVVQLPLAQRPAPDDLQRALVLRRRRVLDDVRNHLHCTLWRDGRTGREGMVSDGGAVSPPQLRQGVCSFL